MADLLDFIGFRTINSRSLYLLPFTFLSVCLLAGVSVSAQEDEEKIPANLAAPAVKIISKEEKDALANANDIKDRTKLALELMEARLKKAEALATTGDSYSATLNELGSFHALMDDTIRFLNTNNNGGGKIMSTYKRFEMTLRTFMPRLEIIRRDMPERFEYHVRRLLITVRDTRSRAVEPFYSTTVLPGGN